MKQIEHISTALNSHPVRVIEPGNRAHVAVAMILEAARRSVYPVYPTLSQ